MIYTIFLDDLTKRK